MWGQSGRMGYDDAVRYAMPNRVGAVWENLVRCWMVEDMMEWVVNSKVCRCRMWLLCWCHEEERGSA